MEILIVDDHPMIVEGLSVRFLDLGHRARSAFSLEEARNAVLDTRFDLGVFDLDLSGARISDLLSDSEASPRLPKRSVLLTGTTDRDEIVMALDGGLRAFVPKSIVFDDVVTALLQVADLEEDGEPVIWRTEARAFAPVSEVFPKGTVLAPREREVFHLLKRGLQDKQIAYELGRSVHTVRVQIRSIMRKRGSNRRMETA